MYIVYSKPNCPYCVQAKALLASKGLEFLELELDLGQPKDLNTNYVPMSQLEELVPGVRTVPQIFERLGGAAPATKHIGGFTELKKYLTT
jgi:glutaredoxin 3